MRGNGNAKGIIGPEIYHSYLFKLTNKSPLAEEMDFKFYKTIYIFLPFSCLMVPGRPSSGLCGVWA